MDFLNPYKWMLMLGLIAALGIGYWSWERHIRADERAKAVAEYNSLISDQKAEAEKVLADETAKVAAIEKRLRDAKDNQENEDAINVKTVSILADKLHSQRLLRDPYATGCRQSSGSAQGPDTASTGSGAINPPDATGLLSAELSGFLELKLKEADDENIAYIACRKDSINLRSIWPK